MVFNSLPFCPPKGGLLWKWLLQKLGSPLLQLQQLPSIALQVQCCLQSLPGAMLFLTDLFGCLHTTAP